MKALFPISLNNQRFSTKAVVPLLNLLTKRYDEIYFVIADKLQLYNQAFSLYQKWSESNSSGSVSLFSSEQRLVGTKDERHKWLGRVQSTLDDGTSSCKFHVYAVDEIADRECFDVLRRVRTLFELDGKMKREVELAAEVFARRLSLTLQPGLQDRAQGISVNYIIEEMALSVRLKVFFNIMDEFYVGETIEPIRKLYKGLYMSSVWELASISKNTDDDFRFFEVKGSAFEEVSRTTTG